MNRRSDALFLAKKINAMKKLFNTILLGLISCAVMAIPAKRGVWKTVKLADGTEVKMQLHGDEFCHYWQAEDGRAFIKDQSTGKYVVADKQKLLEDSKVKRNAAAAGIAKRSAPARITIGGNHEPFIGEKKGLIILIEFQDVQFQPGHDVELYNQIANAENFSNDMGFRGSVRDYFHNQSYGQFVLNLDIAGPVRMPQGYAYYGANTSAGSDDTNKIGQMLKDACLSLDPNVNFADYDWDNDGEVDQVFFIYAGYGEANSGDENAIWPHQFNLQSATGSPLNIDGVRVNNYACGNEINGRGAMEGIGTICHEFSHCLGLPDLYDTDGGSSQGLGEWDLMAGGNYNENSFVPAGYSAYERMYAGWLEPVELTDGIFVDGMKGLNSTPEAYIIYNEGNKNEYYMLENRDGTGWDSGMPGKGLMITHVDFNRNIWASNAVNSVSRQKSMGITNAHERCVLIPADNTFMGNGNSGDVWPYGGNNALTNTSRPAAELYNRNSDGTYYMNKPITNITRNTDGTISFSFIIEQSANLFYETFDKCDGKGGNDGNFSGTAISAPEYDNEGWTGETPRGAYQCARYGTRTAPGYATTPSITLQGEHQVSFLAAPYTGGGKNLTLEVAEGNATLSQSSFTMEEGKWTLIETTINGNGPVKLTIKTDSGMMYLDEFSVKNTTSGIDQIISEHTNAAKDNRIFTIDGRYVGTDINKLSKGLYISGGKKIIRR